MADNYTQTTASAATFASNNISDVHHPYYKIEYGADGTAIAVSTANPLPVTGSFGAGTQYSEGTTVGTATGNVLLYRDVSGTLVAVGTAYPLPTSLQTLIAGEDTTNNVLGNLQKPVTSSTYAPSEFSSFGASSVAGTVVKGTAGNVYSAHVTNAGTALRYFQLFNGTSAPANGGTPVASYPLPAGVANTPTTLLLDTTHFAPSRYFSSGIALAISSTNGTLGTANVTASEHNIHLKYV